MITLKLEELETDIEYKIEAIQSFDGQFGKLVRVKSMILMLTYLIDIAMLLMSLLLMKSQQMAKNCS
jgi:hypothetical protein